MMRWFLNSLPHSLYISQCYRINYVKPCLAWFSVTALVSFFLLCVSEQAFADTELRSHALTAWGKSNRGDHVGRSIGSARCISCHQYIAVIWKQGPHASAARVLSASQQKDQRCGSCHVSVLDLEQNSQSIFSSSVSTRPISTEASLPIGVGCESCHGSGKYYAARYVMRDKELSRALGLRKVTAAVCMQCHNPASPGIEAFEFESLWKKIGHGQSAIE